MELANIQLYGTSISSFYLENKLLYKLKYTIIFNKYELTSH